MILAPMEALAATELPVGPISNPGGPLTRTTTTLPVGPAPNRTGPISNSGSPLALTRGRVDLERVL